MNIDKNGDSELMLAADAGKIKLVKELLLTYSVEDINYQNEYGNTALYLAANHRHDNIVELLLAAGADSSIKNSKGETAEEARIKQDLQDAVSSEVT